LNNHLLLLKSTKQKKSKNQHKKSKNQHELFCSICIHEKTKSSLYCDFDTLIRHIRAGHTEHPSRKSLVRVIKNLESAFTLGVIRI